MPRLRLTAEQWIERYRHGRAAIVRGQRMVVALRADSGVPAIVEAEVADADPRCAIVDGRLDAEDLARVLTGFRGQPLRLTPAMSYRRSADAGMASAYVIDQESGMVYILA